MADNTPGSQSDLVRIRPTLIIGLGGTGGDVVLRVRKRFYEKYGSLSEFPIVGFLWIDTDRSEKHILGKEIREFVRMSDTERLMVTITDTTTITNNLKEPQYTHIDKWWYPGLTSLGQMNEGAGQIRAYSRLAFYHHYESIRTALKEANTKVRDPLAADGMAKSPYLKELGILAQVEFNQPTNVYIVCSIAGGTGSGMLLDMSFLVKDVFQEGNSTTSAFLVLPDHFGPVTNERMRANSYALIKELNYYSYGVPSFDVEWQKETHSQVPIPPFDYTYVFDNQNASGQVSGGQPGSQELIFELLADAIFKDFSHGEFADHKRSARINLKQYMNKTFDYQHPRFKQRFICRYGSLGLSTIRVPHDRIITACSYKLAAELLDLWSGKLADAFNPADIPRFVKEDFLGDIRLVEDDKSRRHDILFGLLDSSGLADSNKGKASGLLNELTQWKQTVMEEVARGVPAQKRMNLRAFLEERTADEEKRLWAEKLGPEPEQWGHYPRTMRANMDALFKRANEGIRKSAFGLVDEKQCSIEYSQAVLKETVAQLKATVQALQKKAEGLSDQHRKRSKESAGLLADVGRNQTRSNLDGRKGIIVRYVTERYLTAQIGDNRSPGVLRCLLQERTYREGIELCQRLMQFVSGVERADGRRTGGLVDQLGQLTSDLEHMKTELMTGFSYFSRKDEQPQCLTIYNSTDVENRYYPAYIRNAHDMRRVSTGALARLERTISGLSSDIAGGRTEHWKRALLGEARKIFEPIRNDFHVLKVLYTDLDDQTRENHLRQMINRSAFWATRSGLHGTFRLPEEQIHHMIGLPAPGVGTTPAEASEITTYTQKFKSIVTRELHSDFRYYPIPDTSEIIFYQEAGGFPINYLARVADLRESYIKQYTAGEALHIECHDKKFPDLAILNKEERHALEEAHECYVLGCFFDILEFKGGEYLWMERDGFQMRPHPLGDQHMLILKLSKASSLREKLFSQIRERLDAIHATASVEQMARFVAVLGIYKKNAYGERWGQVSNPEELEFDEMMEVTIITEQEEQIKETPLVRKLGAADLGKRVFELAESPQGFARMREDGRYALPVAAEK